MNNTHTHTHTHTYTHTHISFCRQTHMHRYLPMVLIRFSTIFPQCINACHSCTNNSSNISDTPKAPDGGVFHPCSTFTTSLVRFHHSSSILKGEQSQCKCKEVGFCWYHKDYFSTSTMARKLPYNKHKTSIPRHYYNIIVC